MRALAAWALLLWTAISPAALAAEAQPVAEDPALERRLQVLAKELRCLVCQNESLAASRADLAVDLRRQIREQIREGRSDREIMDYMVARYGDFVRYRPPLKGTTLLLWFGPALLLVAGMTTLVLYLRRRGSRVHDATLSAEEQARADALLSQGATDTEKQS